MNHSPEIPARSNYEALRRAEQRLRLALRAGCIAAWEWDLSTDHVEWSDNAWELLGLRSGHTREFEERIHPDDRERHRAAFKETIASGAPYEAELRFLKPDGSVIRILDKAELQTGPDGQRVLIGITTDITAGRRAEAEALEALSLLRTTLEHIDQGLIMVDAEETVRLYNKRALELLDLPEDLMHGPRSYEAVKGYQREQGEFARSDPLQRQWLDTGNFLHKRAHYVRERPNGVVLEVCSVPLPGGGAVRTFTDITARKRAEDALRLSEERARDFANIASDWFWETDAELRYTAVMGAAQVLLTDRAVGQTLWVRSGQTRRIRPGGGLSPP